jgi:hypothetical protein
MSSSVSQMRNRATCHLCSGGGELGVLIATSRHFVGGCGRPRICCGRNHAHLTSNAHEAREQRKTFRTRGFHMGESLITIDNVVEALASLDGRHFLHRDCRAARSSDSHPNARCVLATTLPRTGNHPPSDCATLRSVMMASSALTACGMKPRQCLSMRSSGSQSTCRSTAWAGVEGSSRTRLRKL